MSTVKKAKGLLNKIKEIQKKVKKIDNTIEHPAKSLGGYVGKRFGHQKRGEQLGSFLGKITGTGDYNISGQRLSSTSIPTFHPNKRGVRVVHREYLGDIRASSTPGAFQVTSYALNPGLFQTFPWLSGFAQQFDQWKPNGIVAFVKTLSSNYSGTTSLGTVILATDYDVKDAPYASKIEMENSEFAVSCNASQSIAHAIECKKSERANIYYVRSGSIAADDNQRFFDLGNLQVATSGCVADQLIGELWISFDITLYKPQIFGSLGRNILAATLKNTAPTTGAPFKTTALTLTSATMPVYPFNVSQPSNGVSFTDDTITFPPSMFGRTFLIEYMVLGTAAVVGAYEHVTSNCTVSTTHPRFVSPNLASSTSFLQTDVITLQGDPSLPSTISYITGDIPTAVTYCYINIYQIPFP